MRVALWELLFMMVVLKLPIVYLAAVVYWAVRAQPRPPEGAPLRSTLEPEPPRPRRSPRRGAPRPPHGAPARRPRTRKPAVARGVAPR